MSLLDPLNHWFRSPQGLQIATAMAAELHPLHEVLRGSRFVQLGACRYHPWVSGLRYRHKWYLSQEQGGGDLNAQYDRLPFDTHSMDAILAPFVFERGMSQPSACLDEMDRILTPMGHVIFFGINPVSLWGGAYALGWLDTVLGHEGKLFSSLRLKQLWLRRGYRQCLHSSFYFIPPIHNEVLLKKLSFLNPMGKMIWPFPAAFYCVILQKYVPNPPRLYEDAYQVFERVGSWT